VELTPLALEVTGAVGREVNELGKDLTHAYETRVLPISNASAAAAFNDAWVYWTSTVLQRGTAEIIYGVIQGEKVPMSAAIIDNSKGSASGRRGGTRTQDGFRPGLQGPVQRTRPGV
jgi:hypothetical protein